jgi:hypothetical protein
VRARSALWAVPTLLVGVALALNACGGGAGQTSADSATQESSPAAPDGPTSAEGDNSIQTWGVEASASERQEAAGALQRFLEARASLDYVQICAQVSPKLIDDVTEQLAGATQGKPNCPQLLRLTINPDADRAVLRAEARGNEVLSFRVDDEGQAFVIYRDRQGEIWAYPMNRDGEGEWKVSLLGPSPIAG